ncbi:unnamed protein product [Leptidea sinapis]|uniref:Uncharacterized protein n=1 Tax=Leptidea sinapis TaxID=189913 RepID=A0A5E4Q919_9NEOP|nr:unnamed protein product [Leptidea sinapis]
MDSKQFIKQELKVEIEDKDPELTVKQLEASDVISSKIHPELNDSCKKSKPTLKQSTDTKRSKETKSHKKSHLSNINGPTHNQCSGLKKQHITYPDKETSGNIFM